MNKKYALTVGINNYPGPYNDLSGCVNDAMDWAGLLGREGYTVQTLIDGGATKHAIRNEITKMLERAGWGDRIVFQFSGHGTWIPDRDGDEMDQRDEALCCFDFESGGLLTDDELHKLFSSRRSGVGVLVLSDSCHSGTMSRLLNATMAPSGVRFISPAAFTDISGKAAEQREQFAPVASSRPSTSLISGCGDHEYSYDAHFNGRPNGAFTRAAIDTYTTGLSLGNWHKRIREKLPSNSYPQTPQMTGTTYRKLVRAL